MEKLWFDAIVQPDASRPEARRVAVNGREAWMLLMLVEAGAKGVTPIDNPAPRISHYTFLLRKDGFRVETLHEKHGGPFSGSHARYVLHDAVTLDGGNLAAWRPQGVRYPAQARVAA
jgi:hypothetical protein